MNNEYMNRLFEISEKLSDPSLTEEERAYYKQLHKNIYDAQTEELKEFREKCSQDLVKSCKENKVKEVFELAEQLEELLDPKMRKFNAKSKKWRKKWDYRKWLGY